MQSWDSVKVTTAGHDREGQAGRVVSPIPYVKREGKNNVECVVVKFDADSAELEVPTSELRAL